MRREKQISPKGPKKGRKERPRPPPETIRNVPPLYDPEISRRVPIPALPASEIECLLLLSVPLGSLNAPLVSHNGKTTMADNAYPKFGLTYSMVITWLLTFVPRNPNEINGKSLGDDNTPDQFESDSQIHSKIRPPFNVVGFQMVSRNRSLHIDIAVTPCSTGGPETTGISRSKKSKRKVSEFDDFCSKVRRFLQR